MLWDQRIIPTEEGLGTQLQIKRSKKSQYETESERIKENTDSSKFI